MIKKLIKKGKNIGLPIIGDRVSEFSIRTTPYLIFKDHLNEESQLRIFEVITLVTECTEVQLQWLNPWNPIILAPLLELLSIEVEEAIGFENGALYLKFANQWELKVMPTSGSEWWNSQYPRPGRPVRGKINQSISVDGESGRLITSG